MQSHAPTACSRQPKGRKGEASSPSVVAPRYRRPARRGVAMLLVIVALSFATVISIAYLASRDNSALLGDNVSRAATARWAAESGLELGVAVLRGTTDWRTQHDDGVLYDNVEFGDATVRIELLDLTTGLPPDDMTEYIELKATATARGITRSSLIRARASEYGIGVGSFTIDFSDFNIFGVDEIKLLDEAVINRWQAAQLSSQLRRIHLGTAGSDAFSVAIGSAARPIDTTLISGQGASAALLANNSSYEVQHVIINDDVHVPDPPDPPAAQPLSNEDLAVSGSSRTISGSKEYKDVHITQSATLNMSDGAILTVRDNLTIDAGSTVQIKGETAIVVYGAFELRNAAIEFEPNGVLRLYVRDQMTVFHGYMGRKVQKSINFQTAVHDASSTSSWSNPTAVQIYSISPNFHSSGPSNPAWLIDGNSVIKGMIYAPNAELIVSNRSAVFGNAVGGSVRVEQDGAVFYAPLLNDQRGYANLDGPMYLADGKVRSDAKDVEKIVIRPSEGAGKQLRTRDEGTNGSDDDLAQTLIHVEIFETLLGVETIHAQDTAAATPVTTISAEMDEATLEVRAALISIRNTIASTSSLLFTGLTTSEREGRRSNLAGIVDMAVAELDAGNVDGADAQVEAAYIRVDGSGTTAETQDWMLISLEKFEIALALIDVGEVLFLLR